MDNQINYDTICKIIGKLFLDFYLEKERLQTEFGRTLAELQSRVSKQHADESGR